MRGFYIKVGENEIGPFRSEAAAKQEAKELNKAGFTAKAVSRTVSDETWISALGAGEQELELDDEHDDDTDDEDIDWDAIFSDDDDDDSDDEDDDDDEDFDFFDDEDEDEDEDSEDEDKDKEPAGVHPFFAPFGKSA